MVARPPTTRLVDARAAAELLGVCRKTLIRWAKNGHIVSSRPNADGKWLFDVSSAGVTVPPPPVAPTAASAANHADDNNNHGVKAIYARVSTRKQLDDLQSQIQRLQAKYPDHVVFSDCASGLNFKRKGLLSLLQLAFERRLRIVRIAHRDRLCSFAYDLVEHVLRKHGAEIVVEADDLPPSAERELAEDVLAIITVFGARLNGSRSSGRRAAASKARQEGASGGGHRPASSSKAEGGGEDFTLAQDSDAADGSAEEGPADVLRRGEDGIQLCKRPGAPSRGAPLRRKVARRVERLEGGAPPEPVWGLAPVAVAGAVGSPQQD